MPNLNKGYTERSFRGYLLLLLRMVFAIVKSAIFNVSQDDDTHLKMIAGAAPLTSDRVTGVISPTRTVRIAIMARLGLRARGSRVAPL